MKGQKFPWQQVLTVSVLCGLSSLTIVGCSRSDNQKKEQKQETKVQTDNVQQNNTQNQVNCDDPAIKQSVLNVVKEGIQQQSQTLMTEYAKRAGLKIGNKQITEKLNGMTIDINNQTTLQATDNGTVTCQASLNISIPSQDLFNASEVYAAVNTNNLQDRLAEHNIRLNNNIMIDDKFSYVVGKQSGDLGVRLTNQPAIFKMVSDVMTNSTLKMAKEERQRQQREQQSRKATVSKPQAQPLPEPEINIQPLPSVPTLVDLSDTPVLTETKTDKTNQNKDTATATPKTKTPKATQTQSEPSQAETVKSETSKPETSKVEPKAEKPTEQVVTETTTETPKADTDKPQGTIKIREATESNSKQEEIAQLDKMDKTPKPADTAKNDKKPVYQGDLKAPSDDSVDMVIVEENRTY